MRRLALAGIALAVIALDGCASDPCGGGCGGCGGGNHFAGVGGAFRKAGDGLRDATARVFHHKKKYAEGCDTCGSGGVVEGVPVEGGVVPLPGPVGPGTIPGATSTPADETGPTILQPLPPTNGGSSNSGTTKSSSVGGASLRGTFNRQTSALPRRRPVESQSSVPIEDLARVSLSPPAGSSPAAGAATPSASSLLDGLTPASLADDVTRRAKGSTLPVEADLIPPIQADPAAGRSGVSISLAPGLRQLSSPRPNLYGGSLPNADGLDWLQEKGIKTLVDLRDPSDADPAFLGQVKARGFQYVSLPVVPATLDEAKVASFGREIVGASEKAVYFFDADGSRAGLIWYVHRLTVDKVDAQLATREAQEIGLADRATWLSATAYIDRSRAPKPAASPAPGVAKPQTPPTSSPSAGRPTSLVLTGMIQPAIELARPVLNAAGLAAGQGQASLPAAAPGR